MLCASTLNRRRYSPNDETLYVAPEEERTDYVGPSHISHHRSLTGSSLQSQPPMANWYYGVLKCALITYQGSHGILTASLFTARENGVTDTLVLRANYHNHGYPLRRARRSAITYIKTGTTRTGSTAIRKTPSCSRCDESPARRLRAGGSLGSTFLEVARTLSARPLPLINRSRSRRPALGLGRPLPAAATRGRTSDPAPAPALSVIA